VADNRHFVPWHENNKHKEGAMKALKHFTICLLTILICPFFASAADTISGTVIDSLSGKAISLAVIKIASPSCSTVTDSQGKYSFTIITTGTIRQVPEISWNARGLSISGYTGEVRYELVDPAGKKFPSSFSAVSAAGIYFLRIKENGKSWVYQVVNFNPGQAALKIVSQEFMPLGKSAAATYVLTYNKTDYHSATRTVSGTVIGLNQKLSPLGSSANLNITSGTVDTLSVTPIFPTN
jgi:hypothetical protein